MYAVGIASNRKSQRYGETVILFSTHYPSYFGNIFF